MTAVGPLVNYVQIFLHSNPITFICCNENHGLTFEQMRVTGLLVKKYIHHNLTKRQWVLPAKS